MGEIYPDSHNPLALELSSEAYQTTFESLRDHAMRFGVPRLLVGSVTPNGHVPLQYLQQLDPGTIHFLFHHRDESLFVESAGLTYDAPASVKGDNEDSPLSSYVNINVTSRLNANPTVTLDEHFSIEHDGTLHGCVSWQYFLNDKRMGVPDVSVAVSDDPDEAEIAALVSGQAGESSRPFSLDDLEAFNELAEMLQDS